MKIMNFRTTRHSKSQPEEELSAQLPFNGLSEKKQSKLNDRSKRNQSPMLKSSDTQRTTLKKSVTFASVFDSIGNEYDLVSQEMESCLIYSIAFFFRKIISTASRRTKPIPKKIL